jgi:hypothetical protein
VCVVVSKNGPPTRVCSEGGPWVLSKSKTTHRLAFGARVGPWVQCLAKTAHRLAFAARVGPWGDSKVGWHTYAVCIPIRTLV